MTTIASHLASIRPPRPTNHPKSFPVNPKHDWPAIDAEIISAAKACTKTRFAKSSHVADEILDHPDKYPVISCTYPKTLREFVSKRLKNAGWKMYGSERANGARKVFIIPDRE